jgi:hypothetical protein
MAQQQDVLATILESFPVAELSTDEQQQTFSRIKSRLLSASDVQEELKTLFKVKGFSDFAAGLLWVVDRATKTPDTSGISAEDETLLLASFRRAVGEEVALPSPPPAPASGEGGSGAEVALASALDKFSEAVQGGTENREALLADVLGLAEGAEIQAVGGEAAQLAGFLADFLKYISENQLFDDIRVINIFSNISSSVVQWANTAPEGRAGLIDEPMNLLRDFRSQFE